MTVQRLFSIATGFVDHSGLKKDAAGFSGKSFDSFVDMLGEVEKSGKACFGIQFEVPPPQDLDLNIIPKTYYTFIRPNKGPRKFGGITRNITRIDLSISFPIFNRLSFKEGELTTSSSEVKPKRSFSEFNGNVFFGEMKFRHVKLSELYPTLISEKHEELVTGGGFIHRDQASVFVEFDDLCDPEGLIKEIESAIAVINRNSFKYLVRFIEDFIRSSGMEIVGKPKFSFVSSHDAPSDESGVSDPSVVGIPMNEINIKDILTIKAKYYLFKVSDGGVPSGQAEPFVFSLFSTNHPNSFTIAVSRGEEVNYTNGPAVIL